MADTQTHKSLRNLITASDLAGLRSALSSPSASIPCCHLRPPSSLPCPSAPVPCLETLQLLSAFAAEKEELEIWCHVYDTYLRPDAQNEGISWSSVQAVARRGDVEFARAFQARDGSWVLRHGERDVRFPERKPMSVARLAVLHGRWEFLGVVVRECGYDLGGEEGLVELVWKMEGVADDECFKRINLLVELGARVRGSGAVEAAKKVNRPGQVVELLKRYEAEEELRDSDGGEGGPG